MKDDLKFWIAIFIFLYMWGSASIMIAQYNEIHNLQKQILSEK